MVTGRHIKAMLVLGGIALVSGLATYPLLKGLPGVLPDIKLHNEITLSMLLTGGAFALALTAGLAVLHRFDLRMLLIPVGVLVAWFLAMEATITVVKNWRPEAATSVEATELRTRCEELAAAGGETSDPLIAQACETLRLADASTNLDLRFQSIQQTAVAYGAGGLVGGFLTVVALLLALPKRFTLAAASLAAVVGAIVASAVMSTAFHYDSSSAGGDLAFPALFTLWQPAVAVTAARMIR
jgi:hypothetical protein